MKIHPQSDCQWEIIIQQFISITTSINFELCGEQAALLNPLCFPLQDREEGGLHTTSHLSGNDGLAWGHRPQCHGHLTKMGLLEIGVADKFDRTGVAFSFQKQSAM